VRTSAALLSTLVVVLVAACAQHVAPASAPLTAAAPSVAGPESYAPISAAAACPALPAAHLPDDEGPISSAYVCVQETRAVPGDGEWMFRVVKGVTSGLPALLLAYRTADAPPSTGPCTADAVVARPLYLHGSRTLAVRAPLDGCGKPIPSATHALDELGTVEISATRLGRVMTQLSQTSGCSDQYKDVLAIEESMGDPRQVAQAPTPVQSGTEVCVYTVAKDPQGLGVGQLSAARQLTGADVARINGELTRATVDASCSRHQHTRFALLQAGGQGGGPTTLVALDGCAVQQDGGWWRVTDRLRALVGG
jgi:hypothetical protein